MTSNNLSSWKPGVSGNPNGRPKGSRNLKTVIRELLQDENLYQKLSSDTTRGAYTPLEAIVSALMIKAMAGDVRAADVLLKHSIDRDESAEQSGFFSSEKLIIKVVDSQGNSYNRSSMEFDDRTGLLIESSAN